MARRKVTAITRKLLETLFESSRAAHESAEPHEFSCVLLADDGVITEFWLVPGTIPSENYAILHLHNLPIDFRKAGTAHSHPSRSARPSEADLNLFAQSGDIHIIIGYPYGMSSWAAYSRTGEPVRLDVI